MTATFDKAQLRPKEHPLKQFFAEREIPQTWLAPYLGVTPARLSLYLNGIVTCPDHINKALEELKDQVLLGEVSDE